MSAERWEFYLDARGLWCWRRVHEDRGIVADSKRCFPTRDACLADAVRHGYVSAPAKGRVHRRMRRAGPRLRRGGGRVADVLRGGLAKV